MVPRLIAYSGTRSIPAKGQTIPANGMVVCDAGAYSPSVRCGPIEEPEAEAWGELRGNGNPILWTEDVLLPAALGDSGGPLWERSTGEAVGTLTGTSFRRSWFTPLEEIPGHPAAPGSLSALGTEGEPLHLVKGN